MPSAASRRARAKPALVAGLAFALGVSWAATSQAERPPLKTYTTADGLPHDSVNRIVRDSRGFIWFCTAEGLSRFDGHRFKNYTQDQGLPHRNVNDLLETRAGTYLIATSAGLSVFDPHGRPYRWNVLEAHLEQTGGDPPLFRTFLPAPQAIRRTIMLSLAEDRQGRIWAGTGNGLFRVEETGGSWTLREVQLDGPAKGLEVPSLLADASGGVLVGSTAGLYRIAPDGGVKRLLAGSIGSIFQDHDGRLWVDRGLALTVLAFDGDALHAVRSYSEQDGLPPHAIHFYVQQTPDGRIYVGFEYGFGEVLSNAIGGEPKFRIFEREKINALAVDPGGALWIGTDTRGAWKLVPTGFTMFGEADGLSPLDEIMSVFPDTAGGVYVASRPNKLAHLSRGRFESVMPRGLANRSWGWHFLDLLSRDGEWWIPGIDGLRRYPRTAHFADLARTPPVRVYTMADGLFSSEVFLQFEDSRGDIWFTTIGPIENTLLRWERRTGRLVRYTTADGLPSTNGPMSFAEDAHGAVWFGYYFGGLARYRDGRFQMFTERDGLPASQVVDLLADSSGRLWIASSGRGLFRVDRTEAAVPVFHGLSTSDGLSSNQPLCLTEDRFGRVYVGTGRGINRLDPDGRLRVFTQDDGLPSNHVTRCAADRSGRLWFVTRNTLLRFEPGIDERRPTPPVLVDRVLINGVARAISELGESEPRPFELESGERQVQVDYFALSQGAAENLRYQYRLDEQDWSAPTAQQSLNLDLAPGSRSLQIRAIDANGAPGGQPARVRLRILRPVWLRWWFVGLVALFAGTVLSGSYRYRMARLREVNAALAEARRAEEALGRAREQRLGDLDRVRARIATDLHDDIGSSLTQIAVLGEVARRQIDGPAAAASQPIARIISISNELVETMSDIVWAINPRKDHLSDLLQRMRRFASDVLTARGIAFRFQVPDGVRDIELGANVRREVFLIFKESLTNIVQHAECANVEIAFGLDDQDLLLALHDDGKGFDAGGHWGTPLASSTRGGNGLINMRRRARDMGGTFDIISRPGEGTTARLRLPVIPQTGSGRQGPTHADGARAARLGHDGVPAMRAEEGETHGRS